MPSPATGAEEQHESGKGRGRGARRDWLGARELIGVLGVNPSGCCVAARPPQAAQAG